MLYENLVIVMLFMFEVVSGHVTFEIILFLQGHDIMLKHT